ncbi:Uncharacterised protein [Mycobacteroides abscessus subsp. abscessus]|nr:Uncharacterised protein [Mycobacteroides abscessus subsp. abscessus]
MARMRRSVSGIRSPASVSSASSIEGTTCRVVTPVSPISAFR